MNHVGITYSDSTPIDSEAFIGVLIRSGLSERRPVEHSETIAGMLRHADLLVTAWSGGELIGVARSVTDYTYCCYVSDLAVDEQYQHRGVGRALLSRTRDALGPNCTVILLAAPAANEYYPRIGFSAHTRAWVLPADRRLV
jgi:GNAT superfamily N-acetyltransferase